MQNNRQNFLAWFYFLHHTKKVQIQFLPAALRHGLTEGRMVGGEGHFGPVRTFSDFQIISHVKKFQMFKKISDF